MKSKPIKPIKSESRILTARARRWRKWEGIGQGPKLSIANRKNAILWRHQDTATCHHWSLSFKSDSGPLGMTCFISLLVFFHLRDSLGSQFRRLLPNEEMTQPGQAAISFSINWVGKNIDPSLKDWIGLHVKATMIALARSGQPLKCLLPPLLSLSSPVLHLIWDSNGYLEKSGYWAVTVSSLGGLKLVIKVDLAQHDWEISVVPGGFGGHCR